MSRGSYTFQLLHDLGGAAWFGGSLMGAVGVNGAAAQVSDATERPVIASAGWARWSPVAAVSIGAHVVGALGLLVTNRDRAVHQAGVRSNTVVKSVATLAALGATAWSGVLGAKVAQGGHQPAFGATEPAPGTRDDVASAQQQLRALQWAIPGLTGLVVGLGAQQSYLQRPEEQVKGRARALVEAGRERFSR